MVITRQKRRSISSADAHRRESEGSRAMNEWSAKIDAFAEDGEFPLWDNANYTGGAMRASGFLGTRRWALVFDDDWQHVAGCDPPSSSPWI
jgi:hypothetical protein